MSPTLKKILLISAFVATAAAIAFGLYWVFIRKAPTPPTVPGEELPGIPGQLPSAGELPAGVATTVPAGVIPGLPAAGVIPGAVPSYFQPAPVTKITADFAASPSLNKASGAVRYYNAADGKFYRVSADGSIIEMVDEAFYNVQKVTWANNQDKAILEYPDNSKIVYNFETKKQASLPKHWENFSFSPDDNQIAAKSIGLAEENRWLVTTNDDGTGTKIIEALGTNADKVQVNWSPARQTVAFSATADPIGGDRKDILLVGLNHENLKALTVEGYGFQPQWSPTGQKLLYSVYSSRTDFKPELWVSNAYGEQIGSGRRMVKLNTWADKCAFADDNTIYCAVPRELPTGAGMAPEIVTSYDDLYKVDLLTGAQTPVNLGGDYRVSTISYDKNSNRLLFTDYAQSGVFEAKL